MYVTRRRQTNTETSQHHRFVPLGGGVISRNLYSSICSSYSSEGKGRHGSFQLRMNAWVCRENWDRLRTRAIPERFWGDDSRRSAISSVRTFTYLPFSVYSLCMCLSVCTTLCVCVCLVCVRVCVYCSVYIVISVHWHCYTAYSNRRTTTQTYCISASVSNNHHHHYIINISCQHSSAGSIGNRHRCTLLLITVENGMQLSAFIYVCLLVSLCEW